MLVSSHLISEIALVADHLIVIGGGRLLADTTVTDLSARSGSLEDAFAHADVRRCSMTTLSRPARRPATRRSAVGFLDAARMERRSSSVRCAHPG